MKNFLHFKSIDVFTVLVCIVISFVGQSGITQNAINDSIVSANGSRLAAYSSVEGIISRDGNVPFWMYSNVHNTVSEKSSYSLRSGLQYDWQFENRGILTLGGGFNMRDGVKHLVQVEELYAQYTKKWFNAILGIKHREQPFKGLSTINGDILWTGNARSMPGLSVQTALPIKINKWLGFKAQLGHYFLNDDRYVEDANIHHKSLHFLIDTAPNQQLTVGLAHYVQWAGVSPEFGQQANTITDYARLFFGASGGNQANDQINALGNHIGSYQINYSIDASTKKWDMYWQSIFEDRSGRELNNFPDGVWGVALYLKNASIFDTLVVEYIQTTSQSGAPTSFNGPGQQSGGDNYFSNSIYRSGWTYQGNIIGLPFILRGDENLTTTSSRSRGIHAGIAGTHRAFDYSLKTTFIKNLGTYSNVFDPVENALYALGTLSYKTNLGVFTGQAGLDVSSINPNTFGLGIGYKYLIN